jgi:hypothetical protein
MNIKKFLKKMAQIADFQAPAVTPEVEPVGTPPVGEMGVTPDITQVPPTDELVQFDQAPTMIETNVAKWVARKNKSIVKYYLQLGNVPATPESSFLETLGFKMKMIGGVPSWSKEVAHENLPTIESELSSIEEALKVPVSRDAVGQMQEFFGMSEETPDAIVAIKQTNVNEQQAIAEEEVKKKLEEMAENLNSEETQAFIDQYLSVKSSTREKVHNYSFLNKMIIAWQNKEKDPETGEYLPRSGFIAPASVWEKEFGRSIKPEYLNKDENMTKGMEIFVPLGGAKTMSLAGMASIMKVLGQYNAMNQGRASLTEDDSIRKFFGYLKSLVAKKKMYQSNYNYLSSIINRNRDKFKNVSDVINYLSGRLDSKEKDSYTTRTTFALKPVIFDIDQTEVIPGQEAKDPKPKIDAIRNMWLGMQNEPDKIVDTLYDALADAAKTGLLMPGKKINIETKNTGSAGGWSSGGDIAIGKDSQGERRFRTLVHEAAHELLHWGSDRNQLSGGEKEIDADATAYIVLNHYGVGTGAESLNYIALITKDKNVIMKRLQPVLDASNSIIAAIDRQKGKEYDQAKQAKNWYGRFKIAHYSEPESKGEGYGGTGQFGERRIDEWADEHRAEIAKMAGLIKAMDWVKVEMYKQELMENYNAPQNQTIVDGIVSSAMRGQRF